MSHQLSPGLLVAAPSLDCPLFQRSVVLLLEHSDEGSFGFILNRPSEISFREVATQLDIDVQARSAQSPPVLVGGPVGTEAGWVLYHPAGRRWSFESSDEVPGQLALNASVEVVRALAEGNGPSDSLLLLGHAGWGPGQLDEEISQGSWVPADLDVGLVFHVPVEDRWRVALSKLGIDPAWMVGGGNIAQA